MVITESGSFGRTASQSTGLYKVGTLNWPFPTPENLNMQPIYTIIRNKETESFRGHVCLL